MIERRKKQPEIQRSPHLTAPQKQSTFQYSSNRSKSDNTTRQQPKTDELMYKYTPSKFLRITSRLPLLVSMILLIVGLFYFSTLNAEPKVLLTNAQSTPRDSKTYSDAAAKSVSGLFSRSKLTINRNKIANDVKAQFPELQSVNVSTPFFSKSPVIELTFAQPAVLLRTVNGSYVLDTRGIALATQESNSLLFKTDKLMTIDDQTTTTVDIGKPALPASVISFSEEVKHQSTAKSLQIESLSLAAGGGELNVRFTSLPYIVKFNIYENPRKSFGTFIATQEQLTRTNTKPSQYIDVRVAERAYIK